MFAERITSAILFRKGVYAEAAQDSGLTTAAWVLVILMNGMSALGGQAGLLRVSPLFWMIGAGITALFGVLAFALTVFMLPRLILSMYNLAVPSEQMVRALGLANIWHSIGVIGIALALLPYLACLLGPLRFLAVGALMLSYLIAIQEATRLGWSQAGALTLFSLLVHWFMSLAANNILISLTPALG